MGIGWDANINSIDIRLIVIQLLMIAVWLGIEHFGKLLCPFYDGIGNRNNLNIIHLDQMTGVIFTNGTTTNQLLPVPVDPATRYKDISLGTSHSCGLTQTNQLKCWDGNPTVGGLMLADGSPV